MGPPVIPCLQALGLPHDADERAVRRAYAQRLKRIDPAADPQGFQVLRDHYEQALQWTLRQAQRRAAAPGETGSGEAAVLQPAVPSPTPDMPDTAVPAVAAPEGSAVAPPAAAPPAHDTAAQALSGGEAVFAEFARQAGAAFASEAAARRALEQALGDDRLVNLEARTFFEWRVACLLMDGWRPGHEFLFGPACNAFNWEEDRRRLALFGPLGAALNAAIDEKLIFYRQPQHQFEAQADLVRRLRSDGQPAIGTLVDQMPVLQALVQRYPHWLRIVTSRGNIARWQEWRDAVPPEQVPAPRPPPKTSLQALRPKFGGMSDSPSRVHWWFILVGIVIVTKFVAIMGGSGQQGYVPPAPTAPTSPWRPPIAELPQPSTWDAPAPRLNPPLFAPPAATPPAVSTAAPARKPPAAAPRATATPAPKSVTTPPAAQLSDEELQAWLRRRESDAAMRSALDKTLDTEPLLTPPAAIAPPPAPLVVPIRRPVPPAPVPDAADDSTLSRHWNERPRYELVPLHPDGPASAPRLGP